MRQQITAFPLLPRAPGDASSTSGGLMRRVLLFVCFVVVSAPAYAQEAPSFDVSGGYSFVRDQEIEENLHGWVGSVTGYFSPAFGITGELGGNYKTLQLLG